MKMKNFKTALFATLIIGLLVITGCEGLFEPPAGLADGKGTLMVSINGADGRTILPVARLGKYEVTVTPESPTTGEPTVVTTGSGTAVVLPAGTYTVKVDGYLNEAGYDDEEIIATKTEPGVVVPAGGTKSIDVALVPTKTGQGTFSYDFDVDLVTDVTVSVYDSEDADGTGTAEETSTDLAADISLDSGVYNVKFEVEVTIEGTAESYTWWEILYIYDTMTSYYGNSNLTERGVLPTIPYTTLADGNGYFYLDLNNWKKVAGGGLNSTPVTGVTAADSLKATFTANDQFLNIGFTTAQQALLSSSNYIAITIDGTADVDTAFRFFVGTPETSGAWNATANGFQGAFSTINNGPKGTAWGGNKTSTANGFSRLTHLMLQQRAAATTVLTIKSIRIDYTEGDGLFFLDLAKPDPDNEGDLLANTFTSTHENPPGTLDRPSPAGGVTFASGKLEAKFTTNAEFLNIPLTGAQTALMEKADTLDVTVWGAMTSGTGQFRYHLGDIEDPTTWNATTVANDNDSAFADLASAAGVTNTVTVNAATSKLKYFIMSSRTATTAVTVEISSIRVAFKNKELAAAVPATADFVFYKVGATVGTDDVTTTTPLINTTPLATGTATADPEYQPLFDLSGGTYVGGVTFPTTPSGLDIRSYTKFTIRVKYFLESTTTPGTKGEEIIPPNNAGWAQVNIQGQGFYKLGVENATDADCTVNAPILDIARFQASYGLSTITLQFQSRAKGSNANVTGTDTNGDPLTGDVVFVELHEISFQK